MQLEKNHDCKGFTLVELLFVVSIIGILAILAIPQFTNFREKGYTATALQDLKNARVAIESFYAENLRYPN